MAVLIWSLMITTIFGLENIKLWSTSQTYITCTFNVLLTSRNSVSSLKNIKYLVYIYLNTYTFYWVLSTELRGWPLATHINKFVFYIYILYYTTSYIDCASIYCTIIIIILAILLLSNILSMRSLIAIIFFYVKMPYLLCYY